MGTRGVASQWTQTWVSLSTPPHLRRHVMSQQKGPDEPRPPGSHHCVLLEPQVPPHQGCPDGLLCAGRVRPPGRTACPHLDMELRIWSAPRGHRFLYSRSEPDGGVESAGLAQERAWLSFRECPTTVATGSKGTFTVACTWASEATSFPCLGSVFSLTGLRGN